MAVAVGLVEPDAVRAAGVHGEAESLPAWSAEPGPGVDGAFEVGQPEVAGA